MRSRRSGFEQKTKGENRSYAKLSLSLQERIINGGYPEVQSRWKVTGIMSFRGVRATRNLNVGVMQTSRILLDGNEAASHGTRMPDSCDASDADVLFKIGATPVDPSKDVPVGG